jgi:hypothetical protein
MNVDSRFVFNPRLSAFIGGPNILGNLSTEALSDRVLVRKFRGIARL